MNVPTFNESANKQAFDRKLQSLQRETLRCSVGELETKLRDLNRQAGYEYLKLTRRAPDEVIQLFLKKMDDAVRSEEKLLFERHGKKWRDLTRCDHPSSPYHFKYMFCFPFGHEALYWYGRNDGVKNLSLKNYQLSNESNISIPTDVSELLSKGPNFRVQPALDNRFKDRLELNLDVFSYRLRWSNKINHVEDKIKIPFSHNTVTIPPNMHLDEEIKLAAFKSEIVKATEEEMVFGNFCYQYCCRKS